MNDTAKMKQMNFTPSVARTNYIGLAIFYIMVINLCLLMASCINEKPKNQSVNFDKTEDVVADSIPLFWNGICKNRDYGDFFNCNKKNCYQVELNCDPFKDLVILTLNTDDSLFDIIKYNRFKFRSSRSNIHNAKKIFTVINPTNKKDTIFSFHMRTKTIKFKKQQDINYFFSKTIWNIPVTDESPDFDGESWKVKGRIQDKEISVVRWNFRDSLYYTTIQKLLDICQIKDYKYKKR